MSNSKSQVYLTLTSIKVETHDTKSLFFSPSAKIEFSPGQFINIGVEIEGEMHYRSYSISSLPTDPLIQLTVKRVDRGLVSNWLNDHLKVGESVESHGIAGNFNIADQSFKRNIIFISGGSGITPIYAMFNHIVNNESHNVARIIFIHCARDETNIIFEQQSREMLIKSAITTSVMYLDQFKNSTTVTSDLGGFYRQGPLTLAHLKQYLETVPNQEHSIFLCGPTGFMAAVKQHLIDLNFDMNCFQQESFTSEILTEDPDAFNTEITYQVTVPVFEIAIEAQQGRILLDVLQENGVPIIAACRSGMCGSCKCKVVEGSVDLLPQAIENGALSQEDIDKGYALACSSRIHSNVSIEI